jgi:PAS domain S-box-containing protein
MKTVLLAYERDQDLAALESVLQSRGHRVLKAKSGIEALEVVRTRNPDALVSDVMLPRLDGFALCRRLREDPSFVHLPVLLHSFRVEGPKYEAFAAEVGAQRFFPRGSTLEELAAILDEAPAGSGTMRMPALVPELLDRREQDRKRLVDLERHLREVEATNRQLTVAERVARERAEHEARARAEFAAAESARVRELQLRIRELEAAQRQAVEAESQARGAVEESRAEAGKVAQLKARINELQSARARLQSAVSDAERAFAAQPTPTWIVDVESKLVHAATDSAAALSGLEASTLRGKPLHELLPGAEFRDDATHESVLHWQRPDGSEARLELRRAATSFAGRASWLLTARDVTAELATQAREQELAAHADALEAATLRGKPLHELLPGAEFRDDATHESVLHWQRPDGSEARLELRRAATSFAGRASWLLSARDVTAELATQAREQELAAHADALEAAAEPCGVVDGEGRLRYGNRALLALLNVDRERLGTLTMQALEIDGKAGPAPGNIEQVQAGVLRQDLRWRRPDGQAIEVEVALAAIDGNAGFRVLTARDVAAAKRAAERNDRDQARVSRLLELAQRSHALTETEILDRTLQLARELTHSEQGYIFLAAGDATTLEVAARHGAASTEPLTTLTRWRGTPPPESALGECAVSQRPVIRDAAEATAALRAAGLPGTLQRQLAMPMLDGGRLAGVLLVADAARPYDDDDRRHVEHIADAAAKLLRRRRSDAEVVTAMDHMERVMFGAIEALARLAETQDACKTGRARRVGDYAAGIGTALGLPGHTVRGLRVMGQLIDVGMLEIPRELLWRPGTLAASEFDLVKTHAERGFEILRAVEFPWPVAETVRQHHERLDGSGYPRGLKGEEILLDARIVAVADAVEAMLSPRPHRPALTLTACLDELQSQAGRRYDARVVKACVKLLRDGQVTAVPIQQEGEAPAGQRIA